MYTARSFFRLTLVVLFATAGRGLASAQSASFELPPVDYLEAEVHDAVAELARQVASGEVELEYDEQHGYLPAVLTALKVPISSQTLVFSKTSQQIHRISPRRPRALYFNDTIYIGWCQRGDILEIAVTDPQQGAIFYTLEQKPAAQPQFVRDRGQCLTCHATSRTQNVPGYLMRSVYADRGGQPLLRRGTHNTDETSPFEERWGGWYVTGTHGEMRHMGNVTYGETDALDLESGANQKTLEGLVSTEPYLSPHSDIVALMVLQHQTQMHNAITAANFETREALHQSYTMNELLERAPDYISESAERRITRVADNVVARLLMSEEYELESPVVGTSQFAEDFVAAGERDSQGRSLRQLDLTQRLFRYPCSFLIYSDAFHGLPDEVRGRVVSRLKDILEGRDDSEEFAHLSATTRSEILEILRDTHTDFQPPTTP
ncbi:hypothetical protein [Roseimaritima ulvae]|uniref:Cytochrome c domain-containing protein n=1 Tax=Roseimaritima ulvae TaxID=980254 RepID=A0A5B9R4R0_9BACT|nr:hypothetical protein [Roseimaritima ulvae]QEG41461.1 hypothetical protein UC8_34830 [Roseimaritima ulvae]